uniref:Polyprotein n=1 Tax=Grapevine Kizil Sapak virus TaxID=2650001 RepID=A0A5P2YAW2_9VIRU|nr:polyprotein [Grapevine Kizil Sapak virus]
MSFTKRTPREEIALRLSGSSADQLLDPASQALITDEAEELQPFFSYAMGDSPKQWLTSQGVELSTNPYRAHSHPVCKTIENHILYRVLKPLLSSHQRMRLLCIKRNKTIYLNTRGNMDMEPINRIVTTRDRYRYGEQTPLKRIDVPRNCNLFIHDEVHYWTHGQLDSFLSMYSPLKLVCTIVFPVEILFGYNTSLLPDVYSFDIEGDDFTFNPDGRASESYKQPLSSGDILKKSIFKVESGKIYAVDIVYTLGAHHVLYLQQVENEDLVLEKERCFGPYPCVDAAALFNCKGRVPLRAVSVEALQKIIIYLFSLKKPDEQSAVAKLRQLMDDEMDLSMMWVVRDLCKKIISMNTRWSSPTLKEILADWFRDLCPIKSSKFKFNLLDDFDRNIMRLKPLVLKLKKDGVPEESDLHQNDPIGIDDKFFYGDKIHCSLYSSTVTSRVKIDLNRFFHRKRKPLPTAPEFIDDRTDLMLVPYKERERVRITRQIKEAPVKEPEVTPAPTEEEGRQDAEEESDSNVEESVSDEVESIDGTPDEVPSDEQEGKGKEKIEQTEKVSEDDYKVGSLKISPIKSKLTWVDLRGRKAAFYSRDGTLAYFHDKVTYRTNSGLPEVESLIDEVNEIMGTNFNTVLVQVYKAGAILPTHADDEDCYDMDPILNLNVKGSAEFTVESKLGKKVFKMIDGDYVLLTSKGSKARHSVKVLSEGRESYTFRTQRRQISLNKAIVAAKDHKCLIDAIAEGLKDDPRRCCVVLQSYIYKSICNGALTVGDAEDIAKKLGIGFSVHSTGGESFHFGGEQLFILDLKDEHFSLRRSKGGSTDSLQGNVQQRVSSSIDKDIMSKALESRLSNCTKCGYLANVEAAKALIKSLWSGSTGINCTIYKDEGFRIMPGVKDEKEARRALSGLNDNYATVYTILGFAGSGKSYGVQEYLNESQMVAKGTLLISPRIKLMADWKEKVKGLHCCTFESALKKDRRSFHSIILDEYTLFPPGYLDALLCLDKRSAPKNYYLIGDPLQSQYYSESDKNKLVNTDLLGVLSAGKELNYLFSTRRCNKRAAKMLGVPSFSETEGLDFSGIAKDLPSARAFLKQKGLGVDAVLVSSRLDKNRFEGVNTYTFGESQGLTFDSGVILLTEETRVNTDNQVLVALTRFRKGCCFIFGAKGTKEQYRANSRGLLARVLDAQVVSECYYKNMTTANLKFIKPEGAGKGKGAINDPVEIHKEDNVDREERLRGDPWLKSMIFLGQRVDHREMGTQRVILPSYNKIHLPLVNEKKATLISEGVREKYKREIKTYAGASNQFREERRASDNNYFDLPQCSTSEAIYMNHSMRDQITFWAAIKKRLRFAEPEKNFRSYEKKKSMGEYMFRVFLKHVPLDGRRNGEMLKEALNEFEVTKLRRSAELLASNAIRSDPDTREDEAKIFLKTQMCTKFEKRFCEGKAGQTIACFHHNILVKFSPYCRYMEKKLAEAVRKSGKIYIHQKKNFDELNEFVKENYKGSICVESDYEAYDRSQDATVLAFEVALMRHLHIQQEVIDDYILMKCTLGSKMGSLAIMRFTGEFCTFLFNTMANIAFTAMRYQWRDEVILFAGDDMCAFGNLPLSRENDDFFKRMTLKAKVNRVRRPMFCGWILTPDGLYKEPALLYDRLRIAKEKDRLHECLNSYFEEFMYAYKLGSRLDLYMTEEQMEQHYLCVRFFLRYEGALSVSNRARIHKGIPSADEYSSD